MRYRWFADESKEKDEFGLVEVTGKKLADAAGKGASGKLEVIEAEIYEPLTTSAP